MFFVVQHFIALFCVCEYFDQCVLIFTPFKFFLIFPLFSSHHTLSGACPLLVFGITFLTFPYFPNFSLLSLSFPKFYRQTHCLSLVRIALIE